jgi:hypothetical protein
MGETIKNIIQRYDILHNASAIYRRWRLAVGCAEIEPTVVG